MAYIPYQLLGEFTILLYVRKEERERERDVIFCSSLLMKSEFSFYMLLCYIKINQHYSLQNILLFQIYVCIYIYIYITNMMYTYSEIFCIKGKRAEPCQWLLCSLFLFFSFLFIMFFVFFGFCFCL